MNEFKYSLDRSSKKFICPSCGKRRFVRYINHNTNEYLEEAYGRCDRETSCSYHKSPKQNEKIYICNHAKLNVIPDFISPELVNNSLKKYHQNNFVIFLQKHFAKDEVEDCIQQYSIGTSKNWEGATIFWQIDKKRKVHTGKIILFDKITCKRIKNPYPHISWVHKKIGNETFKLQQCLFGLHLVTKENTKNAKKNSKLAKKTCKTIAIVESEKTAIIMSLFLPDFIWIATGSKQNLKMQSLEPIKNENIIIYPDKGEFFDWNKKAIELRKHGFKINCSSLVENLNCEIGTDLADIYFAMKTNPSFVP